MTDQDKSKEELINELVAMRERIAELEGSLVMLKGQHRATPALSMTTDISGRKTAEAALADSEERLQLALRGADLGLLDYNLQTGEAFISQRRADMVGYSVDELKPHISSWGSMVHPDDVERVVEAFNDHAKGETPFYECEHRLRCKSGEYIWVLARAKIVERDATGSPVRLIGTSLDITDRKRAEETLRKANDELELKVQERTAELIRVNEKLLLEIDERKRAEESLRIERQQLLSIFDSINEVISVVDAETYEILYTNKFVKDQYGKELIGTLCFKELHGSGRTMHPLVLRRLSKVCKASRIGGNITTRRTTEIISQQTELSNGLMDVMRNSTSA